MTEIDTSALNKRPISQMRLPPEGLEDLIYAGFIRDTTGCDLPPEARFNHFAAAPLCTLAWFFSGESLLISSGGEIHASGLPVPAMSFSGPQRFPSTSWNSGEVSALMVSFYPDAFLELTGLPPADYKNRTVPLGLGLNSELAEMGQAVLASGNPEDGWFELMNWLRLHHRRTPAGEVTPRSGFTSWTGRVLKRAAHSGLGRSVRQMERRIKQMTGQTRRELERFATLEQTFFKAIEQQKTGRLSAADVAAEAGFADQSHMGRNVRAQTGHSPMDLMQRLKSDEAFWCYRLIADLDAPSD